MDSVGDGEGSNSFKEVFKFYKTKKITPDFSNVVDFEDTKQMKDLGVEVFPIQMDLPVSGDLGLKPIREWKIYSYPKCQGLLFIQNPFTMNGQKYWIRQCLLEYPKNPNKTNLDIHHQIPAELGLWTISLTRNSRFFGCIQDLRWVTMGYHHDWNSKVYNTDDFTPVAENLKRLTEFIAKVVGFPTFVAEATIVNFYHMDSTLAGHTDHSEYDLDAPLLSISFGQTAVFLLGGHTKDIKPVPMFLRSGDIVIMSGYSRLSYHAVPRILFAKNIPWLENTDDDTSNIENKEDVLLSDKNYWESFENYIKSARINLNVRQVFPQKL